VMVGSTGPTGSGLPQLGLPRLFAICSVLPVIKSEVLDLNRIDLPVSHPGQLAESSESIQ
jgi:hypothetical protein